MKYEVNDIVKIEDWYMTVMSAIGYHKECDHFLYKVIYLGGKFHKDITIKCQKCKENVALPSSALEHATDLEIALYGV